MYCCALASAEPLSNIKALLAAVKRDGFLTLECPAHNQLLEALNSVLLTSVSPERGFSWLKLFLTRMSQGIGGVLLDNCMQVAMNAPADTEDDEAWCLRVVQRFCSDKPRRLDSPNYKDAPNQARQQRNHKNKPTAAQIICHPSSFTEVKVTKTPLPTPSGDGVDLSLSTQLVIVSEGATASSTPAAAFLKGIVAASSRRLELTKQARLNLAMRVAEDASQARAQSEEALQAEEARLSSMTPEVRDAEERAEREASERCRARVVVVGSMQDQHGTGSVLLMAPQPDDDASVVTMATNQRRSTRVRRTVRLDADRVEQLNRLQIQESRAFGAGLPTQRGRGRGQRARTDSSRGRGGRGQKRKVAEDSSSSARGLRTARRGRRQY